MEKQLVLNTGRFIGPNSPAYIIAEIGSNHDGSLERAKYLISLAKEVGADAVKFQSFQAERLTSMQETSKETFSLLQKLSLPAEWHPILREYAEQRRIDFISTPFDLESLKLLDSLDVPFIKIASGDLTFFPLLKAAAQTGRPILLSTGASFLGEIDQAVRCLEAAGCSDLILLQCTLLYPTPIQECHLRAINMLQNSFKTLVGFSDHSFGDVAILGAIALGACVIEKHFTDDSLLPGPDHGHSMEPKLFSEMVLKVRQLEAALGSYKIAPLEEELRQRPNARRAIYSARALSCDKILDEKDFVLLRPCPEGAIFASDIDKVLGRHLKIDLPQGAVLEWGHI